MSEGRTISMSRLGQRAYEYRTYLVTHAPGKGWHVAVGPEWEGRGSSTGRLTTKRTRDAAACFIDRRIYTNLKRARAEYQADLDAVRAGAMSRGLMRHANYPLIPSRA